MALLTKPVKIDNNGFRVSSGRLAQLDRALVSGTKGREFESRIAHHTHYPGILEDAGYMAGIFIENRL